jgi:hypothetical protein
VPSPAAGTVKYPAAKVMIDVTAAASEDFRDPLSSSDIAGKELIRVVERNILSNVPIADARLANTTFLLGLLFSDTRFTLGFIGLVSL